MVDLKIKDVVKDNHVYFVRYRQGYFYYRVDVGMDTYVFPVPQSDIGDATLDSSDKAIIFMRYIRKAIGDGTFVPYILQE